MKQYWRKLAIRFDALSQRERIIIIFAVVTVLFMGWLQLVFDPITRHLKQVQTEMNSTQARIKSVEQQLKVVMAAHNVNPDEQNRGKLNAINQQIAELDKQLREKMQGLVEPKQMARVLEAVLTQQTDLRLQGIKSLGVKPLMQEAENANEKPRALGVYQHNLQIEFTGSYLSMLHYLEALQKLPWKFYWDSLQLKTEKYPLATITITVHTLSFGEGLLGV